MQAAISTVSAANEANGTAVVGFTARDADAECLHGHPTAAEATACRLARMRLVGGPCEVVASVTVAASQPGTEALSPDGSAFVLFMDQEHAAKQGRDASKDATLMALRARGLSPAEFERELRATIPAATLARIDADAAAYARSVKRREPLSFGDGFTCAMGRRITCGHVHASALEAAVHVRMLGAVSIGDDEWCTYVAERVGADVFAMMGDGAWHATNLAFDCDGRLDVMTEDSTDEEDVEALRPFLSMEVQAALDADLARRHVELEAEFACRANGYTCVDDDERPTCGQVHESLREAEFCQALRDMAAGRKLGDGERTILRVDAGVVVPHPNERVALVDRLADEHLGAEFVGESPEARAVRLGRLLSRTVVDRLRAKFGVRATAKPSRRRGQKSSKTGAA